MKPHNVFTVLGILVCVLFIGCSAGAEDENKKPDPIAGKPSGTAAATADGFASTPAPAYMAEPEHDQPGQPVSVTVTVTEGYITDVKISGPDETVAFGGKVIQNAPAKIKEKNSFDIAKAEIDGGSGATYTLDAIKNAGKAALDKITAGN